MMQHVRSPNVDRISPEPVQNSKTDFSKCISLNNIKSISNDIFNFDTSNTQDSCLAKSLSGTNIQMNGCNTNEQSSSSASGISSPSNNSNREDEER